MQHSHCLLLSHTLEVVQAEPLAPQPGFEPGTLELTALCSAVELRRNVSVKDGLPLSYFTTINLVRLDSATYFAAANTVAVEVVFGMLVKTRPVRFILESASVTK